MYDELTEICQRRPGFAVVRQRHGDDRLVADISIDQRQSLDCFLQIPNFDGNPLQRLIEELLFSYQVGKDVTHQPILVLAPGVFPRREPPLPGSFGLLFPHRQGDSGRLGQVGQFVEPINELS